MWDSLLKFTAKLYFKHWVIGYCQGNISEIIRSKNFPKEITWLRLNSMDHVNADPFPVRSADGGVSILFEDFALNDFYGKIFVVTLDNNFEKVTQKLLLDTKSHLSYPFTFNEDNKIFVFPESSHNGRLSCYEYDPANCSFTFVQEILKLPLLDSTILKHNGKYWLFGTLKGMDSNKKLYIYFSDNLLGPFMPHPRNPVKNSVTDSRPAGKFIEVDGELYRPAQNCQKEYGESITINKVKILNESDFEEEPYMVISPDMLNLTKDKVFTMHTINVIDDLIVVDGLKWTFSLRNQWKYFLKNREYGRQLEQLNRERI
jgi:hypothetical protein